jgi:hypothetical protein
MRQLHQIKLDVVALVKECAMVAVTVLVLDVQEEPLAIKPLVMEIKLQLELLVAQMVQP